MAQIKNNDLATTNAVINSGVKDTYPIFLAAIIFSFFINLLMFVSPLYMLQIYDRVVGSRSITTLIALTILAGFLLIGLRLIFRAGRSDDDGAGAAQPPA